MQADEEGRFINRDWLELFQNIGTALTGITNVHTKAEPHTLLRYEIDEEGRAALMAAFEGVWKVLKPPSQNRDLVRINGHWYPAPEDS